MVLCFTDVLFDPWTFNVSARAAAARSWEVESRLNLLESESDLQTDVQTLGASSL